MRTALLTFLILFTALPALAAPRHRVLLATATGTGLDGDALSGSPVSNSINVGQEFVGSAVDWQVTITPGSTTAVAASCEESVDNSVWVWIMHCDGTASATCVKQTLNYDVSTVPGFSFLVEKIRAPYLRCTFTGTGSGTISATAVVSSP
jgi:hypothetical protein